jgi:hypothetical protein
MLAALNVLEILLEFGLNLISIFVKVIKCEGSNFVVLGARGRSSWNVGFLMGLCMIR